MAKDNLGAKPKQQVSIFTYTPAPSPFPPSEQLALADLNSKIKLRERFSWLIILVTAGFSAAILIRYIATGQFPEPKSLYTPGSVLGVCMAANRAVWKPPLK